MFFVPTGTVLCFSPVLCSVFLPSGATPYCVSPALRYVISDVLVASRISDEQYSRTCHSHFPLCLASAYYASVLMLWAETHGYRDVAEELVPSIFTQCIKPQQNDRNTHITRIPGHSIHLLALILLRTTVGVVVRLALASMHMSANMALFSGFTWFRGLWTGVANHACCKRITCRTETSNHRACPKFVVLTVWQLIKCAGTHDE